MFAILQSTGFRHIRQQWLRTFLSLLGIIMGVSSFIFAPSIAQTIQASAQYSVDDIAGKSDLEVRGAQSGFDANLLSTIQEIDGVKFAAPLANPAGLIAGEDELLVFIGIDPSIDRSIRTYNLAEGQFIEHDNEILLNQTYAAEKNFGVGDTLQLVSNGGTLEMQVVGLLEDSAGISRLNSGDMVVMPLEAAFMLRGERHLDAISIIAQDDISPSQLTSRLTNQLPTEVQVDEPAGRNSSVEDLMRVLNLQTSLIAATVLGLGSFLIYNTMSVSVVQRRSEIGILRSLGMTRRQVQGLFILEAGLLGMLGSIGGLIVGYGLVVIGRDLPLMPPTNSSSLLNSTAPLEVPTYLFPISFGAGLFISAMAGFWPARQAAQVDPVEALTYTHTERGFIAPNRRRTIAGIFIIAICLAIVLLVERTPGNLPISTLAVYTSLGAVALLFGSVLMGLGHILPPLMERLFGISGTIAADNLTRRPRRVVATGSLLMITIWMMILSSGSTFGYGDFVNEWNTKENIWDLTVSGAGTDPFNPLLSIPPDVIENIENRPDVAHVVAERNTHFNEDGKTYYVRAIDFTAFNSGGASLLWNDGGKNYEAFLDPKRPLVALGGLEPVMEEIQAGDIITLQTPSAEVEFEVAGTIFGVVSPDQTTLVMDRETYQTYWQDDEIDRLHIMVTDGYSADTVRRDLLKQYAVQGVVVFDSNEMTDSFLARMNSIQSVSRLISLLMAIISVGGITSTMFILIYDRRRDFGMLRAMGMVRRQIVASVLLEAILLMLVACLIALPGGIITSVTNSSIVHELFGIRRESVELNQLVYIVIVALVTTLGASYIPARMAGRVDILQALHQD